MSQQEQQPAAPPGAAPAVDENRLLWVDMEMSGLSPESDRVLELAVVIADAELNVVAEGPVIVVHQDDSVLEKMDSWNRSTHARSGLISRVRESRVDEAAAQRQMLEWVARYVPAGRSPMCGNSICQDRRFMARWMPQLEAFFHYRNLDVSTLKELCRRWQPALYKGFQKRAMHTALADIHESIDELKYYREHFLIPSATGSVAPV